MISIIICSIKHSLLRSLEKNISKTIGNVIYEIIVIDNLKHKWSITKAYNYGYEKALYNNLLFIHEDILFENNNWGQVFISELKDYKIGLIGVAGSSYKSRFPSAFWHLPLEEHTINIVQHYKDKQKKHINRGFSRQLKIKVLDGVFLGLKKHLGVKFNEEIQGFHCYDLAISIDVLDKGYNIKVTDKILIEHFSSGLVDKIFLKSYILFHKKYRQRIKRNVVISKKFDIYANKQFIQLCIANRFFSLNLLINSFLLDPSDLINLKYFKMGILKLFKYLCKF